MPSRPAGIFVFRSPQSGLCRADENKKRSERSEQAFILFLARPQQA